MFLKSLKICVRWSAINLACLTMVLSPVAMGREAENLNEKKLQTYLQEFGLNEKTTLGEFWEKTKIYYPGFIYKDLEKFAQENKNLRMPQMNVSTMKGVDGSPVTVLKMTTGNKTDTLQIFDEKNKWAKFNNVVLSENDMRNVGDAFKKLEASDIRIKKEADKYLESRGAKKAPVSAATEKQNARVTQDFARFKGFPRMTPVQWKQMTPMQRAGYIVNMRLLWREARKVLRVDQARKENPTAKPTKKFSSFEEFSKALLGYDAEAAGKGTEKKTGKLPTKNSQDSDVRSKTPAEPSVVGPTAQVVSDPYSKKCIVAGWTSSEGKGTNYAGERETCSENNILASQQAKYQAGTPELAIMQQALSTCETQGRVACNPIVYAYNRQSGGPICVDKSQKDPGAPPAGNYQKATWWEGPCDKGSQLTTSQIKDELKLTDSSYAEDSKRYDDDGNIKEQVARSQIARVEADQKNEAYKLTKDYLDSVLKNRNVTGANSIADLLEGKKPWSSEIDGMLIDVQSQFEVEIGLAIQSCERSIARKDNVDKNQKGACDQLHRRWLFTERVISEFRSNSCLDGSTYVWKLDAGKLSADQIGVAAANKNKVDANAKLCQCPNNGPLLKFNEPNGCNGAPIDNTTRCPEGMVQVGEKSCACNGSTENIPIEEAIRLVGLEGIEQVCSKPKTKCDFPAGDANYDYETCSCIKGELKDENEQGFISKYITKSEKKPAKMVCKESSILPWVIGGGLALLVGFAIFGRDRTPKRPNLPTPPTPPLPPTGCNLSCTGNSTLNPASCKCDPNPPTTCAPKMGVYPACFCPTTNTCVVGQQIYDRDTCQCTNVPQPIICADGSSKPNAASCPKCPDGSEQTKPMVGRPGGCPQSSEGGSGDKKCYDSAGKVISCSGGIPTGAAKK